MNLEVHLTAQQIESVGVESSKGEFEIDFGYILLQGLQRRMFAAFLLKRPSMKT